MVGAPCFGVGEPCLSKGEWWIEEGDFAWKLAMIRVTSPGFVHPASVDKVQVDGMRVWRKVVDAPDFRRTKLDVLSDIVPT